MVEIIEKLWKILWLWSPLLLAIVIWLSRSSSGFSKKEKKLFWISLALAFFIGLIGMLEVRPGGWNIQLLFRPFFLTKWMFIGYSLIWPILVFVNLSKQAATVIIAKIIILFGISALLISTVGYAYVMYKNQADRKFWDDFFENNEINKPLSELKKRSSKEGRATLSQHLRTGYTTSVESLEIILKMCTEHLDDIKKNRRPYEVSYIESECEQGLKDTALNRTINREFIEKLLLVKDKNGNPSYGSLLATNASTPVDILVRLSHLPVPPIYNLSSNSNTPAEILEVLACDDKEFDRVLLRIRNMAKRKKLSTADVDYLVNIRELLNKDNHMKKFIQRKAQSTLAGLKEADRSEAIIKQAMQTAKRNEILSIAGLLPEILKQRREMNGQQMLGMKEVDRSEEIIKQAIHAVKRKETWSIAELLSEIKERQRQMNTQLMLLGLKEAGMSEEIIKQTIREVKRNKAWSIEELLSEINERRLSMRPREHVYYGMLLCITGNYEKAKWAYQDAEHSVSAYGQYNKEHLPQYITTLLLTRRGADALLIKMSTWYPNDVRIQEFVKIYPKLKQELEKFAVDDYHHPDTTPESMERFLNFKIFD